MAHTFAVDDVAIERAPLKPLSLAEAFVARGVRELLACDGPALLDALPLNGFAMAVHLAYTQHRPLVLSPDTVWLCIAQGLARHVEVHAEALRPRLVRHTGKLPLYVRRDELAASPSSAAEWSGAVAQLCDEVRKHLGGRADLFVADFTTTDARSRVASQITLLGAMQQHFQYSVGSLCGIPRITVLGEPADWANILRRVRVLDDIDLELARWRVVLEPVLEECEAAAGGRPSRSFWEGTYKLVHASGGERISGWINALFPYLEERGGRRNIHAWQRLPQEVNAAMRAAGAADRNGDDDGLTEDEQYDEPHEFTLPKLADFPPGIASTPFTWELLSGKRPMQLIAGFAGVTLEGDAVAPAIAWAVAPAQSERRFRAFVRGNLVQLSPRERGYTSLDGLGDDIALDGYTAVQLSLWSETLTSLEGLAGVAAVVDVSLMMCNALDNLEPLVRAPGLRRLHIQQCAKLVDLSPLAQLQQVQELAVNHCPNVVDYTPLAHVRGLTVLDLFGDGVPAAVRGRHAGTEAVAAVQQKLASGLGKR